MCWTLQCLKPVLNDGAVPLIKAWSNPGQDDEEAPDDMPEEPPHKEQKLMVKAVKEA